MLTSSTVPDVDTGETAWVSGTTYALADERTYNKRKYERIVAGAGAVTPDLDTTNWRDSGATNKWAMFDNLRSTGTSQEGPLTVVITPAQRIKALYLRVEATSVTVTVTSGGETVYSVTRVMQYRYVTNFTSYFFGRFKYRKNLLLVDLPPYTNAVITITINNENDGALATCGACCIGMPVYMGKAEHQAASTWLNFSTIERDTFAQTKLIPRPGLPGTSQVVWAEKYLTDSLFDLRSDTDAVPCVWSALDDKSTDGFFNIFLVLGVWEEFQIMAPNAYMAKITLQVREV